MKLHPLTSLVKAFIYAAAIILSTSCQWMGEFPAPGIIVELDELSAEQEHDLYRTITRYLYANGFKETPMPYLCLSGEESYKKQQRQGYRYFELKEAGTPYVIGVSLCVDQERRGLAYQFEETDPRTFSKVPPVFSLEACRIITGLNRQVAMQVGQGRMDYNHSLEC